MAKNERGAGRKMKYAHKSKAVTFSIPEDVVEECKTSVREIIDTKAERAVKQEKVKTIKDLYQSITYPCGCVFEKGLLKRSKDTVCKLRKDEHKH